MFDVLIVGLVLVEASVTILWVLGVRSNPVESSGFHVCEVSRTLAPPLNSWDFGKLTIAMGGGDFLVQAGILAMFVRVLRRMKQQCLANSAEDDKLRKLVRSTMKIGGFMMASTLAATLIVGFTKMYFLLQLDCVVNSIGVCLLHRESRERPGDDSNVEINFPLVNTGVRLWASPKTVVWLNADQGDVGWKSECHCCCSCFFSCKCGNQRGKAMSEAIFSRQL